VGSQLLKQPAIQTWAACGASSRKVVPPFASALDGSFGAASFFWVSARAFASAAKIFRPFPGLRGFAALLVILFASSFVTVPTSFLMGSPQVSGPATHDG
jgi:hypothetical protein